MPPEVPDVIFVLGKKTMHLIGKIIFVLRKKEHGGLHGGLRCPHHRGHWGVRHPSLMPPCFFDNLVKKLDNLSTSNIDIYPSTLKICINYLLKLFFFGSGPPPYPNPYQRPPHPLKIILMPNIFNKTQHIYLQSMFRLSFNSNAYSFNMKYTYI